METTSTEYIDLLSTSSLDLYPNNVGSRFTNKLVVPQNLPEEVYVGLTEISYTNSFYNVVQEDNSVTLFDWFYAHAPASEFNPSQDVRYGKMFLAKMEDGFYDSPQKVCDMMNKAIQNCGVSQVRTKKIFSYDSINRKFSYDVSGLWISLWLRGPILHLLGVERKQATNSQYVILGKSKVGSSYNYQSRERFFLNPESRWNAVSNSKDRMGHVCQLVQIDTMVIYTDIITSQVTGDCFSDTLRMVPIKGEISKRVVQHFERPYYLKVNKRYIPSITIYIKDLFDNFIDFKQGIVRLKLRFIRQNENY